MDLGQQWRASAVEWLERARNTDYDIQRIKHIL